jgi:hypothetical protein
MDVTFKGLLQLARDTVASPRDGARQIMAINAPMGARWTALMLMAVGSAILTHLSFALMPPAARDMMGGAMSSPFRTAILQGMVLLIGVHLIHRVGRGRGGHGTLPQAVSLVAWLQFVLLCLQAVQLVMQVILPPVADLIGLFGLFLFFWLLTHFVAEMHGFQSLGGTLAGIVGTLVVLAMVLGLLLGLLVGNPQTMGM